MTQAIIIEILARGAACGLSLLIAINLLQVSGGNWAARLGALFTLGSASYAVLPMPELRIALEPIMFIVYPLSVLNGAFFWWFATALFDDDFQWHWWRIVPFGLVVGLSIIHFWTPANSFPNTLSLIMWQILLVLLMGHAAYLALHDFRDDLVEPRRRFRVVFAGLIGLTGIFLAVTEIIYARESFPAFAFQLQSAVVLILSFSFSIWMLQAKPSLFEVSSTARTPAERIAVQAGSIAPEDQALVKRLTEAMDAGIYRELSLTVGGLATQLRTPEHRLRKLINNGLGHRNFSSFLNTYRLEDAKQALADPERARDQILTIALDLGFGSIAPFNRAFKTMTGTTPTAYRREALARH